MKKKFNKKKLLMFGILGVFALALVSAIVYYSVTINVTADITEPFVTTIVPIVFSGIATNEITEDISITNKAQNPLEATITWTPRNLDVEYNMEITALNSELIGPLDLSTPQIVEIPDGVNAITLTFSTPEAITKGTLHLTQKNLDDWIPYGDTADIVYTKIGSEFSATDVPVDYTLVYYPDTGVYTGKVYLVEGEDANLPFDEDIGDDYCGIGVTPENPSGFNPGVTICEGAKLWLIPNSIFTGYTENTDDGSYTINWNDADSFLFETGLITYTKVTSNSIGTITVERLA